MEANAHDSRLKKVLLHNSVYFLRSLFSKMATEAKKAKRLTSFDHSWENDFPVRGVADNQNLFYCIPCKKTISCGHMGRLDVERHCDPTKTDSIHNKNVKAAKKQKCITTMLCSADSSKDKKVTQAEIIHTNLMVQHNIPFAVADHLSKVSSDLFFNKASQNRLIIRLYEHFHFIFPF